MTELDNQEKKQTPHALKRPGLFAVKAILENTKGGWGRFSDLAVTTEGVRNRRDYLAYIRLLIDLGWLEARDLGLPTRGVKRRKTFSYYEVTSKGQEFLDSFPKENKPKENAADHLGKK